MKKSRLLAWSLSLLDFAGIAGLAGWSFLQSRRATEMSHERWVQRITDQITAERQSLTRWVDNFQYTSNLMGLLARSNKAVGAVFVVDHVEHETARWVRPTLARAIRALDPRLVVLELKAL